MQMSKDGTGVYAYPFLNVATLGWSRTALNALYVAVAFMVCSYAMVWIESPDGLAGDRCKLIYQRNAIECDARWCGRECLRRGCFCARFWCCCDAWWCGKARGRWCGARSSDARWCWARMRVAC